MVLLVNIVKLESIQTSLGHLLNEYTGIDTVLSFTVVIVIVKLHTNILREVCVCM